MLSVGINVNLHYCGGEIAEISIKGLEKGCACETSNSMTHKHDCCENTLLTFQLDKEEQQLVSYSLKLAHVADFPACIPSVLSFAPKNEQIITYAMEESPPMVKPIYLLNQTLIFYG